MTNKKTLGIIGLVALALIAAVLIYRDTSKSKIEITGEIPDALKNAGISMTGDGKVEMVSLDGEKVTLPSVPSLDRVVAPASSLDQAFVKNIQSKMATTITNLKNDLTDQSSWIALGGERKALGDYEGARDAWEYAKALAPTDATAWNNLGDLYHFYLKDYQKSEENWRKLVTLEPEYITGYRGLYELYSYSMKEKASQIPVILKEGIAKNPDANDLKALLADYEASVVN